MGHKTDIGHLICIGSTASPVPPINIDCGQPTPPRNGIVTNISRTTQGATIIYSCDSGFIPARDFIATCTSNGVWRPVIENLNCTREG